MTTSKIESEPLSGDKAFRADIARMIRNGSSIEMALPTVGYPFGLRLAHLPWAQATTRIHQFLNIHLSPRSF